ncbi:MAG TPA: alpha/beta fold hydrolase [Gemmatimonadota bacterium]|nr:alpha/beta fold hydrolase [Gemmatimonadota bacterium]
MRILAWIGAAVVAWGIVCVWYYFRQESIIFQPSRLATSHEFRFDRPFEEHWIEVEPGVELNALLFPASASRATQRPESTDVSPAGNPVVLYLHGNAGHLQDWGWHADLYVEARHDFLVIDYRGYGKSGGRIESEAQLHADIDRVWKWTTARYDPADVTLVGYSLGAALAARLACESEPPPARLVLLASFYSARDLARRLVPYVPIGLLRYPLRTDLALSECRHDLPIAIFHGEGDRTVPFSQGRRLAELLGSRARLIPLPDATHQDIAADPLFRREMARLLNRNGESRSPAPGTRTTPGETPDG